MGKKVQFVNQSKKCKNVDMVADYVASIVSQFGSSAFHEREVVLDVILELLKGRREAFVECLANLGITIIDREMAEQVVFEVINGVQPDKVYPDGVMEILKVYTETKIARISHSRDYIGFAGRQILIQSGDKLRRQFGAEHFNRYEVFLFTFGELFVVGAKEIGQVCNYTFTHHEVFDFFESFHIIQSF